MRSRAALACAVAVAALLASPAGAARTYCRLATEQPGDEDRYWYYRGVSPYGPWDLKSLDVAASATTLVGVIRLADLTNGSPTASDDGGKYELHFSAGHRHYVLVAEIGGGLETYELWAASEGWPDRGAGSPSRRLAVASGVADRGTNEIRLTVPLSALGKGAVKRGTLLSRFGGASERRVLHTDPSVPPYFRSVAGYPQDEVSARRGVTYPVGAPSCVKVKR